MRQEFGRVGYQVSEKTLGDWIRGSNQPKFEVFAAAAEMWAVSLDEVVSGKALERTVSEQLERQAAEIAALRRRDAELEGFLTELACAVGVELGHLTRPPQPAPEHRQLEEKGA